MFPAPSHCTELNFFWPSATQALYQLNLNRPASRDQVNNGDNQCDHEQKMDQTASHMEPPAQKPKDDEDCKNRPKHRYPFKSEDSSTTTQGEKRLIQVELSLEGAFSGKQTSARHLPAGLPKLFGCTLQGTFADHGKEFSRSGDAVTF